MSLQIHKQALTQKNIYTSDILDEILDRTKELGNKLLSYVYVLYPNTVK